MGYCIVREVDGAVFFRNKTYLGIGKCGDLEIPNHHPALVDQETWDKVQTLRHAHPRYRKTGKPGHPRRKGSPSLLSGVAVCVHCGAPMEYTHSSSSSGRWYYYICSRKKHSWNDTCIGRSVGARRAETAILNVIIQRIFTRDFLEKLLADVQSQFGNSSSLEQEILILEREIRKTKRIVGKLLDIIEDVPTPSVVERLKQRETQLQQLLAQHERLKDKKQVARLTISEDALGLALSAWIDKIQKPLPQDKANIRAFRDFLFPRFVSKIELGYDVAKIWYAYPFEDYQAGRVPVTVGSFQISLPQIKYSRKKRKRVHHSPSERDLKIYRLHVDEHVKVKTLAQQFGLSEKRIWSICTAVRKYEQNTEKI